MADDGDNGGLMPLPPREKAEEFYSRYELGEIIGQGTAVVRHCTHLETGEEFAVKIIDKSEDPESTKHVVAEIDFLKKLDYHPNIIRLNDSFQTDSHFFLVFELARCGELFELLTEKVFLPEDVAKNYMRQIFEGVQHIHANKVVHRDLKLENLLLMGGDVLKISDFGFAADVPHNENLYELCGTPGYLAPEMIRAAMQKGQEMDTQGYSYKVDMWACGVILYTILVGFPPFWNSNRMVLMRLIMRGKFEFLSPYWDPVSEEAKDLVSHLLAVSPQMRFTATEALRHPWMQPAHTQLTTSRFMFRVVVYCVLAAKRFARNGRARGTVLKATDVAVSAAAAEVAVDQWQQPTTPTATAPPQQPEPLGPASVTDTMYAEARVRKAIDECAFRIYGHWVKKSNAQNRAALFENYLIRHM